MIEWNVGNTYEGDFKDDKRNGKGKYTYKSGTVYEGDFLDNWGYIKRSVMTSSGDLILLLVIYQAEIYNF